MLHVFALANMSSTLCFLRVEDSSSKLQHPNYLKLNILNLHHSPYVLHSNILLMLFFRCISHYEMKSRGKLEKGGSLFVELDSILLFFDSFEHAASSSFTFGRIKTMGAS